MGKQIPDPMDKELHDEFLQNMDKVEANLPEETDQQESGWFGKVKEAACSATNRMFGMLESFAFYRMTKDVAADVAIENLERSSAKIIRGFIWRVFDKYTNLTEGSVLYSFRHDDAPFWKTTRTVTVCAAFITLSGLFTRQAGIFRDNGDDKLANTYEFIGRACIKAAFMEAGYVFNIDAMINSGLDYIVGMLPDIRKEVESATDDISKNAEEARKKAAEATAARGVKVLPPRGSGKGVDRMAA